MKLAADVLVVIRVTDLVNGIVVDVVAEGLEGKCICKADKVVVAINVVGVIFWVLVRVEVENGLVVVCTSAVVIW